MIALTRTDNQRGEEGGGAAAVRGSLRQGAQGGGGAQAGQAPRPELHQAWDQADRHVHHVGGKG